MIFRTFRGQFWTIIVLVSFCFVLWRLKRQLSNSVVQKSTSKRDVDFANFFKWPKKKFQELKNWCSSCGFPVWKFESGIRNRKVFVTEFSEHLNGNLGKNLKLLPKMKNSWKFVDILARQCRSPFNSTNFYYNIGKF